MPTPHVISKRSFCTTGSIWLPQKSCAEEKVFNERLYAACKPRTAKCSLTETCCFALNLSPPDPAKNANLPSRYRSQDPEHNFLLHQISERANLVLDARSLF